MTLVISSSGLDGVQKPVVGRSFWDFVEETQGQSVVTFAQKYTAAISLVGVALFIGVFALGWSKK